MCEPTTIMALTAASAVVGAAGSITAGNYQAAVGKQNAAVAKRNAEYELAKGDVEAEAAGQKGAQLIGEQRTSAAANGVLVNSGSAVRLQSDTAGLTEQDKQTIRWNAQRKAYGYEVEGQNARAQGLLAQQEGYFKGAESLLSGASSVGKQYSAMRVT